MATIYSSENNINLNNQQNYYSKNLSVNKVNINNFKAILNHNNTSEIKKSGTDLAHMKLAQEFVAEIYSELWKEMNANIEVDSLFGGGFAEEMFRSNLTGLMVHKAYDDLSTPQSQAIYKSLKKKQELDEQKSSTPTITKKY